VRARRKHLFKTINSQHLDSHRLSTEQRLELWGRRILGLQEVLTAYESVLKTYSLVKAQRMVASRADRPRGEDSPSVTPNRLRSTVAELVSRCRRSIVKFGRIAARPSKQNFPPLELTPERPETLVPELQRFSETWGLGFPMPPSFPLMLEQVFTIGAGLIHPLRIQQKARHLVLEIKLGLPKKWLLAFADGALHHFVPHTIEWKARSNKPSQRPAKSLKPVNITHSRKWIRIRIPLENGQVFIEKRVLIKLIGNQISSGGFLWRPRKEELAQMLLIADYRRLNRDGCGPRRTMGEVAKIVFPASPEVYRVRDREERFHQLRAMLRL
jgi:hypothetical protein